MVEELHKEFSCCGLKAKEWMRKCELLLPQIERYRVWEKKGFSSIYEYAAKLAGMSRDKVNESLRIFRKIEDKPALMEIAEKKGVFSVKPVLRVATVKNQKFWAKKVREMGRHTLEEYVRARVHRSGTADLNIRLSEATKSELEKLKGDGGWEELMKELIELKKRKDLALKKLGKPKPVKSESRYLPKDIENYVLARAAAKSGFQPLIFCEYPGCCKPYKDIHHSDRFALYHIHDPDREYALCREHHSLAHHGLIENEDKDISLWALRDDANQNYIDQKVMSFRGG